MYTRIQLGPHRWRDSRGHAVELLIVRSPLINIRQLDTGGRTCRLMGSVFIWREAKMILLLILLWYSNHVLITMLQNCICKWDLCCFWQVLKLNLCLNRFFCYTHRGKYASSHGVLIPFRLLLNKLSAGCTFYQFPHNSKNAVITLGTSSSVARMYSLQAHYTRQKA